MKIEGNVGIGELELFSGNKQTLPVTKFKVRDCYSLDMLKHLKQHSISSKNTTDYYNFLTVWTVNTKLFVLIKSK